MSKEPDPAAHASTGNWDFPAPVMSSQDQGMMAESGQSSRGCPDGGLCDQLRLYDAMCAGSCQRVRHDRPLYGRYPGDRWPDEVVAAQYPAWHLLIAVRQALRGKYGLEPWTALPAGLRLEIHPAVYYRLMRDPDAAESRIGDVGSQIGVPVKVTTDLPHGAWRLVIITEEVLLGWLPPSQLAIKPVS